ncbi:MAG: tRNA (guanosine(46)-N7)-methyltransferase TrmB [Planctomycetota bacterium]|nr:tRNA (guanosine(46)-N7)-methyltransferase TrmB [Planctomycetota bacterium]
MSFGLGHGRQLDPAMGVVGVSEAELPALPDAIAHDPDAGRLDPRQWFPEPAFPFEVEIGTGKGTFLVQQAMLQPGVNFLGIEWAREFAWYAADRVRRRQERGLLKNVRVLHSDATTFLRWRMPRGIVRVVHLYFSDPWPKARHHKKRVVQDRFLGEVWRALEPGGELRVVTDHDDLWAWDQEHFARWTGAAGWDLLRSYGVEVRAGTAAGQPGPFVLKDFDRPESAGAGELVGTNFERKFRKEGRGFHAGVLQKVGE